MNITVRKGRIEDADACGSICYQAFKVIADAHHFPPDFPNAEAATGLMRFALENENAWSIVAESQGKIVGSNFLWETPLIAGIGPITVNPDFQNAAAGRMLMESALRYAADRTMASVRLVQAAYHNRSLALYTKLGFDVQEPLSVMQGPPLTINFTGYHIRPATEKDLRLCNQLCYQVHGHDRSNELSSAIKSGTAALVEQDGTITGYTTGVGFLGHTVAKTNTGLKVLIGAAKQYSGAGFLLPSRNAEVFRWCLQQGLRVVQPMTLMSKGLYNQPAGAFLPSVIY